MDSTNSLFKDFQREFVRSVQNVRLLAYQTDTMFALTDYDDDKLEEFKWNQKWSNKMQTLFNDPLCVIDIHLVGSGFRHGIVIQHNTNLVFIQIEILNNRIRSRAMGHPTNQVLHHSYIKLTIKQVKAAFIEHILQEDPKYRLLFATGILKET